MELISQLVWGLAIVLTTQIKYKMAELRSNLQIYEKDGMRVVHEYFSSINQMLNILEGRKNNEVMRDEHSSTQTGGREWSGTDSYEEAVKLLTCGYTDILDKLRLGIQKATKSLKDIDFSKNHIIEDVQGASPIVPNYLQGLPKTMCYRQSVPKKIKTINIIYSPCANCGSEPEEFIEAGVAILSAIRAIEKSNISIKLDCMFSDATSGREAVIGIVRVKNYRDRLDLQKLCFPMAHPSMLRRIGFKYIETAPDMKESGFTFGYGRTPSLEDLEGFLKLPENTVLLNMKVVRGKLECDPKKVIDYINEKVQNR